MNEAEIQRLTGTAPNGKAYESVWDFPRPPAVETVEWRIRVVHGGEVIADAPRATRVLETSQPPAYYVDPQFVNLDFLRPSDHGSFCEWKGMASYAHVIADGQGSDPRPVETNAAWKYDDPSERFAAIAGCWAFYAQVLDECYLDDERVAANPGMFYGGWLTQNVTGPVKGAPGTLHW